MSLPPCSKRRMMPDGRRASCGPAATALDGKPALFDAASTCRDCALIGGPIDGKAPADHEAFVDLIVSATGIESPTREFVASPAYARRKVNCPLCTASRINPETGNRYCDECACPQKEKRNLDVEIQNPKHRCPRGCHGPGIDV